MTTHALFRGGNRTANYGNGMFPQTDVAPDDVFEHDARRGDIDVSITEIIAFKDACGTGCSDLEGSAAMAHYFKCNTFAVGDVIQTHILARYASLREVWWMNSTPLAGLTVQLRVRGNASSLGGTQAAPLPQVLHAFDMSVVGNGLLTFDPIYLDQNDMLELVITAMPTGGIECMNLILSPVVREYCRGFNGAVNQ